MSTVATPNGLLASAFLVWLNRVINDTLSTERRQAYTWLAEFDPAITPDTLDVEELTVEQLEHLQNCFTSDFSTIGH